MIPDPLIWLIVMLTGVGFGILMYFNASELKSKLDALKASMSGAVGGIVSTFGHAWSGWGYLINLALIGNLAAVLFWVGFVLLFVILLTNTIRYKVAIR